MRQFLSCCVVLLAMSVIGCATPRERYVKKHPGLTEHQRQAILDGKLYIGMPKEAVLVSIGRPTRINADFMGSQVIWYYDYDRSFGTHNTGIFKTAFIVELVEDKVYNWRED